MNKKNSIRIPFSDFKPLEREIYGKLESSFARVISNSWYIRGNECESFEKRFASFCMSQFCVGVASGLDALTLALRALKIGENDEVIVPANTFIATALAVTNVGAKPIFVDPDIETYNISLSSVVDHITDNTKAIIAVHLYGRPCEMDELLEITKKYNLFLIEDCAQAHGAMYKGRRIGSFGDIAAFSFYPGKNLGALGDGGAIITNNNDYYHYIKAISNYGSVEKYVHLYTGVNSRLDELQAAFLNEKLDVLDRINEDRNRIANYYLNNIRNDELILPCVDDCITQVWHIFPIRCNRREELIIYLNNHGVETGMHYPIPLHLQKCYQYLGYKIGDFPNAENISKTELSLPIYYGMTETDLEYVVKVINGF